jgi:hypothetical protein
MTHLYRIAAVASLLSIALMAAGCTHTERIVEKEPASTTTVIR